MADEIGPRPDALSADFEAMKPHWDLVATLMAGRTALLDEADVYLPTFPDEDSKVWEFRQTQAKFTNIFRDVTESLASRPFADPVKLSDEVSDQELIDFTEDVDAQGNSMHVFAENSFFNAISYGIDWIVVDYDAKPVDGETIEAEKAAGVRPYWRRYSAPMCLAAYTAIVAGEETFVHVRFAETKVTRVGFNEHTAERVRVWDRAFISPGVYGPPTVEVWELRKSEQKDEWILVEEPRQITIEIIPVVPLLTGRRKGMSWQMYPPMKDAAELQLTHFKQESSLEHAKTMSAFPILSGNGVAAPKNAAGDVISMVVGPQTILYAPPSAQGGSASWSIIEPNSGSLVFLAADVKATAVELRELGRQPLTGNMGNITVIASAVAGQKGASAIQSWSHGMRNTLQRCLEITNMWLKKPDMKFSVSINTDFDLTWTDDDGFEHLLAMRATGDISRVQLIAEGKRRGLLDRDYDEEADLDNILKDLETALDEEDDDDDDSFTDDK